MGARGSEEADVGDAARPGEDRGRGREALLVLLVAALLLVPCAWERDLFDADEGRYAAVALDMVRSGDPVTPRLNGMPFMDKPPLVYWVQAVGTEAFGSSEIVARSPTLLAGCLWVLLVFLFARDWSTSRRAAWFAALLAATSAAGVVGSRVGPQMDMPLAVCVTGALYAAWRGLRRPGLGASLGLGLAVGLGLLTKGPLVVAVPFLVGVAWMLCGVEPRRVLGVVLSPWAWGLALLVAAPWYVLVERAQPGWIHHFVTYEHFGRFGQGDHRNFHPFWFYVPIVLLYLVPWTPLAWSAGGGGRRVGSRLLALVTGSPWSPRPWRGVLTVRHPIGRKDAPVRSSQLAWTWFLAAFLLYSASTRKLLNYLLPAAAPLFVLVGARFDRLLGEGRRLPFVLPLLIGVAAVAGGIIVAAGGWFPLATGNVPSAVDAPRFEPLGAWMIIAGAVLLAFAGTAFALARREVARSILLVAGVALFWWGLDIGCARIDEVGSARRIAECLAAEADAGRVVVTLKRYPQGIRFYADLDVWIAGGTPDCWRQREIVNPYGRRTWEARVAAEKDLPGPAPHGEGGGLLTDEEFDHLWKSERSVALVCRWGEIGILDGHVLAGPFGGAGRTDLYVVTNHPRDEAGR